MKNIIILLNIGILLVIISMIITESAISIIGGADGVTDIVIMTVYEFGIIYMFFVAVINIYWVLQKCE